MKKVTKKELFDLIQEQSSVIQKLSETVSAHHTDIIRIEKVLDVKFCEPETCVPKPKLKVLDQSVFDGLDAKWRFAVMQSNGYVIVCNQKPFLAFGGNSWDWNGHNIGIGGGYDASNWQNSLIERDIAKELLEVDLSSELTGSDLARAMLANASKPIMCAVSDISTRKAMSLGNYDLIHDYTDEHSFMSLNQTWIYAIPINNQGEPLTASEVGL